MEQNGTNSLFSTINEADGTINTMFGTFKTLIFRLFRMFHLFHEKYACYGDKTLIQKTLAT